MSPLEHRGLMLALGSVKPCEAVASSAAVVAEPTTGAVPPRFVAIPNSGKGNLCNIHQIYVGFILN